MTQAHHTPATNDALLARYHAAQAALDAQEVNGPSTQTRANILNYAAQIATNSVAAPAIKQDPKGLFGSKRLAANDHQWKIRALATVALFGLTSLLLLQWDRGTPEEKELAFSTARPQVAAPTPATTPAPEAGAVPPAAIAAVQPVPPAVAAAEPVTAANSVGKSGSAARSESVPPRTKPPAPKLAPQTPRTNATVQPLPIEAEAARPTGVAPPMPAQDSATATESARTDATAMPAPAPSSAPAPALAAAAPSIALEAPAPAPARTAQAYGAAPSARRHAAPAATAQLKKSDSADDKAAAAADASAPATAPAASPNLALFAAIRSADAAAVRRALASGADKNAKRNGTPAITLCVQSGHLYLVELLAAAGADVNAADAQGTTPLAHARARGFDAIANALLGLGAN